MEDIVMRVAFGFFFEPLAARTLCGLGIAWLAAARWTEEPWLPEPYGEPFECYRRQVPRFLGRVRGTG